MRRRGGAAARLAALAVAAWAAPAGGQVDGSLAGLVRDLAGTPQMGASVDLLTAAGRPAKRVRTDYRGWFQFTGLFPGAYSVEVRQDGFAMASRSGLEVRSGRRTVLDISLRGVFASLQLSYGSRIRDMSDRWKWILRAQHSRRNVLRLAPDRRDDREEFLRKLGGTFEDTRVYAEFSAGQGGRPSGARSQEDLGPAFALATSLFGDHEVTVSGNAAGVGSAFAGASTAFRTAYTTQVGEAKPEVALTVRQVQSSALASRGMVGPENESQAAPSLETLSLEFGDAVRLTDSLRVEYGLLFESVRFVNRVQFASPYGKAVYELRPGSELVVSYASGVPPAATPGAGEDAALRRSVRQLGMFPRVAMAGGRPTVQRTEHMEVAFRERLGDSLLEVAAFRDSTRDAALTAAVPDELFDAAEMVPDLRASTVTLNGGAYDATGMRVSYARRIRDRLQVALGYARTDVLAASRGALAGSTSQHLRSALESRRAHLVLASVSTELAASGTALSGSYQWSSREAVLASDPYNDFASQSAPGLNLRIRQPLPLGGGMPGRFEAGAEFRNILKTGYVPLELPGGEFLNLLQAIRSYSGTLTYIF